MRSDCIAALPPSVSSYAWKAASPTRARPHSTDHAKDAVVRRDTIFRRAAPKSVHPSLPWKAYLASRELQNLASDVTDAVFTSKPSEQAVEPVRPAIFMLGENRTPCKSQALLLAPILSVAEDGAVNEGSRLDRELDGLAIAA